MLFLEERGGGKEVFYGVNATVKHWLFSPRKYSKAVEITAP